MGLFRDLIHIGGNVAAVRRLTTDVRKAVLADGGADIEKLPAALKQQIEQFIKSEYLDGNTSVETIARSVSLRLSAAGIYGY